MTSVIFYILLIVIFVVCICSILRQLSANKNNNKSELESIIDNYKSNKIFNNENQNLLEVDHKTNSNTQKEQNIKTNTCCNFKTIINPTKYSDLFDNNEKEDSIKLIDSSLQMLGVDRNATIEDIENKKRKIDDAYMVLKLFFDSRAK